MSFNQIVDVLKKLRLAGVYQISFTGGEIFLRNDILKIIKVARDMYFDVILLSNISLINEKTICELEKLFVSGVSCTIFSMREEVHDNITGIQGSLKNTLRSTQLLKKSSIPLTVKTVVMNQNYTEIEEIEKYCKQNGFFYSIDCEVFMSKNGNKYPLECRISKEEIDNFAKMYHKINKIDPMKHHAEEILCEDTNNSIFINCKGDIFACDKIFLKLGNVLELEDIKKFWENTFKLKCIQNIKWGDLTECITCQYNSYCHVCPGMSLQEMDNLLGHTAFMCDFAKARARIYEENQHETVH